MQIDDKVKVADKMAFPLDLDLRSVGMGAAFDGGSSSEYELAVVLCHKGAGAHQGHYGTPLFTYTAVSMQAFGAKIVGILPHCSAVRSSLS